MAKIEFGGLVQEKNDYRGWLNSKKKVSEMGQCNIWRPFWNYFCHIRIQ